MSRENLSEDTHREEIRGLFVLGLLAVLATVRIQNQKMMVTIGQLTLDAIPILDFTLVMWSFYAFFTVLGLSEGILGQAMTESFKGAAKAFLTANFIILAAFATLFGYFAYPSRLP